jgi:hypothetical protein
MRDIDTRKVGALWRAPQHAIQTRKAAEQILGPHHWSLYPDQQDISGLAPGLCPGRLEPSLQRLLRPCDGLGCAPVEGQRSHVSGVPTYR